jgi:hypothetical protein
MGSTPERDAQQRRGEAAIHKAVAQAQEARAAAARRLGADDDADEASFRARRARERARQATQEAAALDPPSAERTGLTVVPDEHVADDPAAT